MGKDPDQTWGSLHKDAAGLSTGLCRGGDQARGGASWSGGQGSRTQVWSKRISLSVGMCEGGRVLPRARQGLPVCPPTRRAASKSPERASFSFMAANQNPLFSPKKLLRARLVSGPPSALGYTREQKTVPAPGSSGSCRGQRQAHRSCCNRPRCPPESCGEGEVGSD